jgi:hypothetical protein
MRSPQGAYGENKLRVNVTLSQEAVQMAEEISKQRGIYRSELIERLVRDQARMLSLNLNPNAIELDADIVFDCELTLLHMGELLGC